MAIDASEPTPGNRRHGTFRSAVLRGLGVFLPPLLTVVIFVWIFGTVYDYVLEPIETITRKILVYSISDIRQNPDWQQTIEVDEATGARFRRMSSDATYVPIDVYQTVRERDGYVTADRMTGREVYSRYVQIRFLKPQYVIPLFLAVFVLLLYLMGRSLGARLGRFFWQTFERIIQRVPMVRKVYSSVKQVTDFLFSQQELQFTRVVAVEYPRKNSWTLGFVTGESLLDIRNQAQEPILAVLVATSPMPMTGFATTVLKSECIDLNMTVEEAIEFIVSCGVVVPPHQAHTDFPATNNNSALPLTKGAAAAVASGNQPGQPAPEKDA